MNTHLTPVNGFIFSSSTDESFIWRGENGSIKGDDEDRGVSLVDSYS